MGEEKKMNGLDEILDNELSIDDLNNVSGGRIKLTGYALLTALIAQMKSLGKSKEHCIESLKHGWQTDCDFKTKFTDQTGDDLQQAIDFIDRTW